ncbi:MAG: trigger factor [Jatrophihabitans sp.]
MKSTVENLGPTRVRLAVEVPFSELQSSIDDALKRLGGQLRIPGFRPGKAPARIIEQRVGRAALLEEAMNDAMPRVYAEAIRETNVQAIGQPDVEVTNLEDGESFSFTAEVDVRPEFELPEYKQQSVTVDSAETTDEQVTEQLDALRERFATLTGVSRPVQTGDYVLLDLVARVDGEEVQGGTASGLSYEVGADDLVDGLDEALVGLSEGESAAFESTLRAGEQEGSTGEVTASVNSVKERELPEADDEFAQLASEFDTLDELKADLRERLGRVGVMTQGSQARELLLEKLLDSVEIPLPESAIKAEFDWREHDVIHQLDHSDANLARFLEQQGKTREEFDADLRETAECAVKTQFLLDSIADAEGVSISDDELTEYLVRQAARYEVTPQEFANQLMQSGSLPAVVAEVRRTKALAAVLETAVVIDSAGAAVDLSALTALEAGPDGSTDGTNIAVEDDADNDDEDADEDADDDADDDADEAAPTGVTE